MSDNIDSLASFNSDNDPLQDLKRRVEQMENATAGGYGAAIEFYKRIIARIELADDVVLDAHDRCKRTLEAVQEGYGLKPIYERLCEDVEAIEKRVKTLGED